MRFYSGGSAVAVAGLLALTAGSASATSFDYSGYTVVNDTNVTISGPVGQNGTFGSGQIVLTGTGPNTGATLAAWCLDVYDDLQSSGTYNIITSGFTNHGGNNPGTTLGQTTLNEISEVIAWGDANLTKSSINSAAAQLAIWSIEYPTDTFSSANSSVNSLVTSLVAEAEDDSLAAFYSLQEVVANGNQGLVYEVPGESPVTPLPATWTMMLIGFAGLGFLAYRGRKSGSGAVAAA